GRRARLARAQGGLCTRVYLRGYAQRVASAWINRRSASTTRSPATPSWSWAALAISAVTAALLRDRTGTQPPPPVRPDPPRPRCRICPGQLANGGCRTSLDRSDRRVGPQQAV